MPKLEFERHARFSPQQMLGLVADMNSYPGFIPNCSDMQVEKDIHAKGDVRFARMAVSFGPIEQSYTSRVTIDKKGGTIRTEAIDGPFSHLIGDWQFIADGEGTVILFDIDFGFSNRLLAAAAEPAFARIQDEILDAFVAEAKRRFG